VRYSLASPFTSCVSRSGLFCSLPDDTAQFFKSVLIIGTAPNAIAVQTVPAVEAVFKSYKIAPGWAQKIFPLYTTPASAAPQAALGGPDETQMVLRAMANNQRAMDIGFACADANIVGNGSNWQTPRECGGYAPNPWPKFPSSRYHRTQLRLCIRARLLIATKKSGFVRTRSR
jgi:hypothetical protein